MCRKVRLMSGRPQVPVCLVRVDRQIPRISRRGPRRTRRTRRARRSGSLTLIKYKSKCLENIDSAVTRTRTLAVANCRSNRRDFVLGSTQCIMTESIEQKINIFISSSQKNYCSII